MLGDLPTQQICSPISVLLSLIVYVLLQVLTAAMLQRAPLDLALCSVPLLLWSKSSSPDSGVRAVSRSRFRGPHQHCLGWLTNCRKYLCRVNSSQGGPHPAVTEAGGITPIFSTELGSNRLLEKKKSSNALPKWHGTLIFEWKTSIFLWYFVCPLSS